MALLDCILTEPFNYIKNHSYQNEWLHPTIGRGFCGGGGPTPSLTTIISVPRKHSNHTTTTFGYFLNSC